MLAQLLQHFLCHATPGDLRGGQLRADDECVRSICDGIHVYVHNCRLPTVLACAHVQLPGPHVGDSKLGGAQGGLVPWYAHALPAHARVRMCFVASALMAACRVTLARISVTPLLPAHPPPFAASRASGRVQLHGLFGALDTAVGDFTVEETAAVVGESMLSASTKRLCVLFGSESLESHAQTCPSQITTRL